MNKFIVGTLTGIALMVTPQIFAQQQPKSCDEQLRHTQAMLDIVKSGRDQSETSLAEIFTRYQDAMRQVEALKAKPAEGK